MDYVRTEVISDKYTDDENSEVISELQGSILWPKRSLLYRLSYLALLPLFALFLLGFSSPFWMTKHQVDKYRGYYNIREKVDVSIGLWRVCEGTSFSDITDCTVIPDITHYIVVCQTMLCLCLIFTVFSLIFGLYENCATHYDFEEGSEVRSKRPEMNAVLAGLFGLTGVCMYGTSIIYAARNGEGAVHWAFLVTTGSVIGVIICGVIMAITNPVHSTTTNFPGQIISLSSQNSLKAREPTIQDRLVGSGDYVVQASGGQGFGTTYGVTGNNFDIKEVQYLQRSESSFSSHASSPEICSVTFQDPGLPRVHKNTYVVEAQDIHARSHSSSRRLEINQETAVAQRQSGNSDDKHDVDSIKNLSKNSSDVTLPSETGVQHENNIQSSLFKDKLKSSVSSNAPSKGRKFKSGPGESADLMIHDELLFKKSAKEEHKLDSISGAEAVVVSKPTINLCTEDTAVALPQVLNDLQRSTVSSGSWENQPWPDPPTENEMLEQTIPPVCNNNSSYSEGSTSKNSEFQLKFTPESILPQSQSLTAHSKIHNQVEESNISYRTLKSNDTPIKSSKANQNKESRKVNSKKSSSTHKSLVPVKQEYDNPLFRSQPPERDQSINEGDCFSFKEYKSPTIVPQISVNPSTTTNYSTIGNVQRELVSTRTPSKLGTKSATSGDVTNRSKHSRHLSNGQICEIPPPTYNRFGKKNPEDKSKKSSVSIENTKSNNVQQPRQNGDVKLHPQHVKGEQQQKLSTHSDTDLVQKQQISPTQEGRNETRLHPTSKLPKLGLPKSNIVETENGPARSQKSNKGNVRTKIPAPQMSDGSDVSGQ